MEIIVIDRVEPQPENVIGFPQYLLCRLIEQGPALLKADMAAKADPEAIEWHIKPRRKSGDYPPVIHSVRRGFRPTLARFGFLCGISPYGGHALFQIRFADEEKARPEQFAIYLCNEPTMGFWVRIYLYAIAGVYPNYGGMFDKKPGAASSSEPGAIE